MSSDSEESNASAHNEDVIAEHMGTSKSHSFAQLLDKEDSNGDIQNGTEQMELAHELEEQQELASIGSGTDGMTFTRHRSSQKGEDEQSSISELPLRSIERVPGSAESASTPDDTPSIQVCSTSPK